MKDNCLHIKLDELTDLLTKICSFIDSSPIFDKLPEPNPENILGLDDSIYIGNSNVIDEDLGNISLIAENSLINLNEELSDSNLHEKFEKAQQLYLILPDTPSATLLVTVIQALKDSKLIKAFHPDPQNPQKHEV